MTANVQISGKSDSGIIFVVGGNDADDFLINLSAVVGDRQSAEDIMKTAAALITPPSSAGRAAAPSSPPFASAQRSYPTEPPADPWGSAPDDDPPPWERQQTQQQPAQQAAGSGEVFCGTHQRPAKIIHPASGGPALYKCVVNDTIISNWKAPGIKPHCPAAK